MNHVMHPFHLVEESPWPLLSAVGGFNLVSSLLNWFHNNSPLSFLFTTITMLLIMLQWWRDVTKEGSSWGFHSKAVELGLRWGMILFIVSEVMFFASFFWAFFHSSLAPNIEIGGVWPPNGVIPFNPFEVPLLNTLVLLSSGVSVTSAHHYFMSGNHNKSSAWLAITVALGIFFTFLQGVEYYEASFSMADSVFGSTFFIATGFHGLHVIIGTLFLTVCFIRAKLGHFSRVHHFGFEAAAWYWHFVDVVWLFLFISIYWWGGSN